ncbi:MAG: hypothetical protein U0228_28465 [Myxococcaceae bacterium]
MAARGLRGVQLRARLDAVPFLERETWVDVVLGVPEAPADAGLPREGVPYLPAGVDEIVAVIDHAPVGAAKTFVDLGAGLGRVLALVHRLTGARCEGVEVQPGLVSAAREWLGANRAEAPIVLHQGDAAALVPAGDVFFLYTPFGGETLARALAAIEAQALTKPVVIATVGLELPGVSWLRARPPPLASLALYDSIRR